MTKINKLGMCAALATCAAVLATFFLTNPTPCSSVPVKAIVCFFALFFALPVATVLSIAIYFLSSTKRDNFLLIYNVLTIPSGIFACYYMLQIHFLDIDYYDRGLDVCHSDANLNSHLLYELNDEVRHNYSEAKLYVRHLILDRYKTIYFFRPQATSADIRRITGLQYTEPESPYGKILFVHSNGKRYRLEPMICYDPDDEHNPDPDRCDSIVFPIPEHALHISCPIDSAIFVIADTLLGINRTIFVLDWANKNAQVESNAK